MNRVLSLNSDFVVSGLRNQINRLRTVLEIVQEENFGPDFIPGSLKQIEDGLKQIREESNGN